MAIYTPFISTMCNVIRHGLIPRGFVPSTLQNGHHTANAICVGPILRTSIVAATLPVGHCPLPQFMGEEEKIEWEKEDEILHKELFNG